MNSVIARRPQVPPRRVPVTATGSAPDPLTALCFDAWLLASHGTAGEGIPEGRVWERAVGELLVQPGMTRRQGPGGVMMFGMAAASGCNHELDGVADGWAGTFITECKARSHGISKADVVTFEAKTFDFYAGNLERAAKDRWWRILVSATSVPVALRRLCYCGGTVLVDPKVLPLPVLTWTAKRCNADIRLPEALLAEMLRLGEVAHRPMQQRWLPEGHGGLRYDTRAWTQDDLDDLVYVQAELSGALLDLYDREGQHRLEHRAVRLRERLVGMDRARSRRQMPLIGGGLRRPEASDPLVSALGA